MQIIDVPFCLSTTATGNPEWVVEKGTGLYQRWPDQLGTMDAAMFGHNEKGLRMPGRIGEWGSRRSHCGIESNQKKRGEDAREDDMQIKGITEDVNASGTGGLASLRSHGGDGEFGGGVGDAPGIDPVHKHPTYTDDLEPLFQNLLLRILNQKDGSE
jgi:hypothetical protein